MRVNQALVVPVIATPGTPASGYVTVYAKSDGSLYVLDSSAVERGPLMPRVVALTDGATVTLNVDTTDIGTVTLGGNRTLAFSGTPRDGQRVVLRVRQDGTGTRTLAYPASVRWSTDVPIPTLSTAAGKTDRIAFEYHAADGKHDALAVNRGHG